MRYTATYSPDDNKLRLYATARLDAETYARVKAAGFRWAPQQELFVAPMWTPSRADLLLDLAGDIGDDDQSLTNRAEDRAERFDDYRASRTEDATRAHAAVSAIADHIPLGQPILVGHHSERHARKDAERIENGMRRAIKMWDTAEYWKRRAAGAIRHAKYKERPDVRQRRIKGLEADLRKETKQRAACDHRLRLWRQLNKPYKDGRPCDDAVRQLRALAITNQYSIGYGVWSDLEQGKITPRAAMLDEVTACGRIIRDSLRWISHINLRLDYERAMLGDAGGTVTERTGPEKGGGCRCWASPRGGWSTIQKVNKVSVTVLDNWGNGGANFTRTIPFDKLAAVMTAADVAAKRAAGQIRDSDGGTGFYVLDTPPSRPPERPEPAESQEIAGQIDGLRTALKAGVVAVSADQLFPTPRDLAERLIDLADVQPGHRVLEPSAGTGALLGALGAQPFGQDAPPAPGAFGARTGHVVAVEVNDRLAGRLRTAYPLTEVFARDFLDLHVDDLGLFDRIVMNPPFGHGQDIKHIEHARTFLAPGGRLVAICANGPRQRAALMTADAVDWIDLEPGAFAESGTNVNAAIVVLYGN